MPHERAVRPRRWKRPATLVPHHRLAGVEKGATGPAGLRRPKVRSPSATLVSSTVHGCQTPGAGLAKGRTHSFAASIDSPERPTVNTTTPEVQTDTAEKNAPPPRLDPAPAAGVHAARQEAESRQLRQRLTPIRRRILVLSGKGGVGKSTVAANLAMSLALAGCDVGLLDVDIHGPSIPKLLGLEGRQLTAGGGAIQPISIGPRLKVMSIGFLLGSPRDAVVWRGPLKYNIIRQFLSDVEWGGLDALIIDSPPGTGDEPLSVAQLIGPPLAAIIVTTPQEVAIADVRRSITFCQQLKMEVLGLVENMSGFVCPRCGKTIDLFKTGGGEALAHEMAVPFLGRIPLDPQIVVSGDAGAPFVQRFAESSAARAFEEIVRPILLSLHQDQTRPSDINKATS